MMREQVSEFAALRKTPPFGGQGVRMAASPGLERGGLVFLSPGVLTAALDRGAGADFGCCLRAWSAWRCCSRTAGEGCPSEGCAHAAKERINRQTAATIFMTLSLHQFPGRA